MALVLAVATASCSTPLPDPDPAVTEGAQANEDPTSATPRSLNALNPKELVVALAYSGDDQDSRKRFAAYMLGIQGDPSHAELLESSLRSERSPAVRMAAARALGMLAVPGRTEALKLATRDRVAGVRAAAIEALGHFDAPEALESLAEIARAGGPDGLLGAAALGARRTEHRDRLLATLQLTPVERFDQPALVTSPAEPKAWYVDGTSGTDSGLGTANDPFKTLSKAISRLRPGGGDTVFATVGQDGLPFREELVIPIDASGTATRPSTLAAWPGRPTPVLDGSEGPGSTKPSLAVGIHVQASYFRLQGITVRYYVESGIDLHTSFGSSVIDCRAEGCDRHGIFAYYAPHSSIINAQVRQCLHQGISLRTSPRSVVLGGSSNDNGIDGLLVLQDSDEVVVNGFTATGNQRGVAFIAHSDGGRIIGAQLRGNSENGVVVDAGCDAQVIQTVQ